MREGRFKGGYKFNIKEQMTLRAMVEKRKAEKVRVPFLGGSQIGRIAAEIKKTGKEEIEVVGRINTRGVADVEEISLALHELVVSGVEPDKVVLDGPGNGLVEHGEPDNRGFRPGKTGKCEKDRKKW